MPSANAFLANPSMATNPVNTRRYILGYSNLANNQLWNAVTQASNVGTYVQDEVSVNDRINLTYGIRFDVPLL
jgi:outer membrane receptor protein involved in Fe transport